MKENYENVMIEVIAINAEEVITTSGDWGEIDP